MTMPPGRLPDARTLTVAFLLAVSLDIPDTRAAASLDRYGGCIALQGNNGSGFFRVERLGDRYYLITPENHAFISLAFTTANYADRWGGYCPPLDSYPNPYNNQARHNGEDGAWQAELKANLRRWGFNSLGCWCQQGVPELTENVRCLHITMVAERQGIPVIGRHFVDVFDPRFAEVADRQAKTLKPYADDPYRIGAFPDNEIGWVGPDVWGRDGGPSFPDTFIMLPASAHGKQFWAGRFLREKHGTIERLNQRYGTHFTDFVGEGNTLVNATSLPDDPEHPAIAGDKADLVEAIADQYYRVVTSAMRKYDPNHLVFSARWALWTTAFHRDFERYQACNERIWAKSGEYCDIIAINSYMDNAALEREHQLYSRVFAAAGKPFMITEWATFADDTQFVNHPEWKRFQHERGRFYFDQMKTLLDFSFPGPDGSGRVRPCVGAQWFQYYDEPGLGRTDGERNNYGLFNVKGEAYQTALDIMATFNAQMCDYVVEGHAPILLDAPRAVRPTADGENDHPVTIDSPQPEFVWRSVEGAERYTLLISPELCFPEGQTIRVDDLRHTSHTLRDRLAPGLWYWCVRAVTREGLGGAYCDPIALRIGLESSPAKAAAYLGFDDLAAWPNVSLDDGDGNGVVWAFLDSREKHAGDASALVRFTVNSLNKKTEQMNSRLGRTAWRYQGPGLARPDVDQCTVMVRPGRAVDAKGNMTVASKYVAVRVEDVNGSVMLDTVLDPQGRLEPLKWHRLTFNMACPHDPVIGSIEWYVANDMQDVPWDQRLEIWLDDMTFQVSASR